MISIIAFIIVMFGSLNWLSIGFFQYDIIAGFFGYQGSLFSRIVYIIIGISAAWLMFSVIKNKGRINPQKLKHDERPMYDKHAKMEKSVREYNEEENSTRQNENISSETLQENQSNPQATYSTINQTKVATSRNHDNYDL